MSDDAQDAPDTHASAQITDHAFEPVGEWWSVCKHCRIGRAAHAEAVSSEVTDDDPQPLPVAEIDKSVMEEHVVKDAPACGIPGPAPDLACELSAGHGGLHAGHTPHSEDPIRWGKPAPNPTPEQDDSIGGGRIQELMQDATTSFSVPGPITGPDLKTTAGKTIVESRQDEVHEWVGATRGKVLVDGERMDQHGPPVPNMERVARGWSILCEADIRPQHVPLMMVWFKLVRESQGHLDDNLTDIEGYAEIMRQVVKEIGE